MGKPQINVSFLLVLKSAYKIKGKDFNNPNCCDSVWCSNYTCIVKSCEVSVPIKQLIN